ncbi:MAG: PHP domain-containing protein [Clostridia bacterium]|nr:PHP domain-containing protein [Clostridia bacterium]
MLPKPQNYAIWPSVLPADKAVELTIAPTEKAFLFAEGAEIRLTIISVNDDEPNYYKPSTRKYATAVAHGGIVRFTYTFPGEQEHLILMESGEKKLQEFVVFSLYEDLYQLTPLKGDLHGHSFRSDGKRDPAALAGHYREQGYDYFALTDHNRFYPGGEIDETYEGVHLGITRVRGEEVHAPGTVVHIVHVGGNSSVTEKYVHHREEYEREVEEYESRVPETVPEKYRTRYARIMWATDHIHQAGGLAIFPHPFWRPGASRMYNVCDEFARLLLTSGMFDAYELVGGMKQPGINRSVSFWGELLKEGHSFPVVGSSDVHGLDNSIEFPHLFNICFARENTNDAIMEAVKTGQIVAVEASGSEENRQYRCYGSLRLVTYAQYLLDHYFPRYQRICQGEGVAMRAYAMEDADASLIELQVKQSEKFSARFFGRLPAPVPSSAMLDFEDRWREKQLNGPLTKGGTVEAPPITRQI